MSEIERSAMAELRDSISELCGLLKEQNRNIGLLIEAIDGKEAVFFLGKELCPRMKEE